VDCKQQGEGRGIHVSPVLDVGLLWQGRERAEAAQGMSGGGRKKNDQRKELSRLFIEKTNCNHGLKLNYRSVIHLTSEPSMLIVKRSCFDEIFASAFSDRPSKQRFKKSNFWSTLEPLSIYFFWRYNKFDPNWRDVHGPTTTFQG
jgi:hypothetical protein